MEENTIIEISDLFFAYENEYVLENMNLKVSEGDFLAIVGSNGTGKSTLLKLLLGEVMPTSGKIEWFVSDKKPHIGYVPQTNILSDSSFPATVEEIVKANLFSDIGLFKFPKKIHEEKTIEALKMVNMEEYLKTPANILSGGQKQRVMIARAIVNNPGILLLDEPTTGVDRKNSDTIYKLLAKLNTEKNVTILMITHDFEKSLKYVKNTFILRDGCLEEVKNGNISI